MAELNFPTGLHRQTVEEIKDFFLKQENIDTILLVNSLARGKATPESDIDIAILVSQTTTAGEIARLYSSWNNFSNSNSTLNLYRDSSKFAQIHLDIIDGVFEPLAWEDGGSIDFFEVEIGNRLLYSAPLSGEGEYFKNLQAKWLPYYDTSLQTERLNLAQLSCLYDLDHIPIFVRRGLYFQAFDRLYVAFQKFLQTVFIKRRTYPIAYNKWIKDQIVGILNLPDLYKELPDIISVKKLESTELVDKAKTLTKLLEQYG
jgi:predicted nucleotidyltransferase